MNYTREQLERGFNFHKLKDICLELGGKPSNRNKEELISLILSLQSGENLPKKNNAGRKSNYEKYQENYGAEDTFTTVTVQDNKDYVNAPVFSIAGESRSVVGTFERFENAEHGFLRGENFKMSSMTDVYVASSVVREYRLRTGDLVEGVAVYGRDNNAPSLKSITSINYGSTSSVRKRFNELEPIYPNKKIKLETPGESDISLREIDLLAPIGFGQRGLIVAPPKAGKTTLIKKIATAINNNYPQAHLIILLIGERPEEVTDVKRSVKSELIYSTFDEKPKNHVRICSLAIEKAKRLVEAGKDVVILMDSITKLTRAYNETILSSGKTLTGGIDPVALQEAKSIFGSARNVEGDGSLTILATALIETGSKMDDVVYEEFKGTGNCEIVLSKKLSERRIFPSIDLYRSGTRKDELLLNDDELDCAYLIRRCLDSDNDAECKVIKMLKNTENNYDLIKKAPAWCKGVSEE